MTGSETISPSSPAKDPHRSLYPELRGVVRLVLATLWRSGRAPGSPRLNSEVRELNATIALQNPHWGTERIRGELLKLGNAVSAPSIHRYRRRGTARPPTQSWRTVLANHAQAIWAADLFVVQSLAFRTLYVFFLISHGDRVGLDHQTSSGSSREVLDQAVRILDEDGVPHGIATPDGL